MEEVNPLIPNTYAKHEANKKYHGYLIAPRHSLLLFEELGYELFGFYLGLIMHARWHRGSKYFGRIPLSQTEIAKELEMTQATVSRKLKQLEQHKYFLIRRKGYMILGFLPLFLPDIARKIHSKNYSNLHELYTDMHRINAEMQDNYAKSQERRIQNATQRLNSSSNDDYSSL